MVLKEIHPTRNRKLVVVYLTSFYNWIEFFTPLEIDVHGIAATQFTPDVCHSKRMLARRDLPQLDLPGWELQTPQVFENCAPSPWDVILCCKQWWSSTCLAQPPMLFLPKEYLDRLGTSPTEVRPNEKLSDKTIKEYEKTAEYVKGDPWHLDRAADYLKTWVNQNKSGTWPAPEPLRWTGSDSNQELPLWFQSDIPLGDEWRKYAPGEPAPMFLTPAPKRKEPSACEAGKGPTPKSKTRAPPKRGRKTMPSTVDAEGAGGPASPEPVVEQPSTAAGEGGGCLALPEPVVEQPSTAAGEGGGGLALPEPVVEQPSTAAGEGSGGPAHPEVEPPPLVLGCSRCKRSPNGCNQCRNPKYNGKRGSIPFKPRAKRGSKKCTTNV